MKKCFCCLALLCLICSAACAQVSASEAAHAAFTRQYGAMEYWPPEVKAEYCQYLLLEGRELSPEETYLTPTAEDFRFDSVLNTVCLELNIASLEPYLRAQMALIERGGEREWLVRVLPSVTLEKEYACTFRISAVDGRVISERLTENAYEAAKSAYDAAQEALEALRDSFEEAVHTRVFAHYPLSYKAQMDNVAALSGLPSQNGAAYYSQLPGEADLDLAAARRAALNTLKGEAFWEAFIVYDNFLVNAYDAQDRFYEFTVYQKNADSQGLPEELRYVGTVRVYAPLNAYMVSVP